MVDEDTEARLYALADEIEKYLETIAAQHQEDDGDAH